MAIIDKSGVAHGSVANIVYRTWKGKKVVQIKPGKIRQPRSTKEAGLEFGLCSSTARAIRQAFLPAYKGNDGGMINRFTSVVRKSVSASSKARGERDIHDADLSFLQNFQFNENSPLDRALKVRPKVEMDQEHKIRVTLPAIALEHIKSPGASEYVIRFIVATFDFKGDVYSYSAFHEISIAHKQPFEGGTISFEQGLPAGRLVALSMSVHGYSSRALGRPETINSAEWSPAELLGLWQLPDAPEFAASGAVQTVEGTQENIGMNFKNRRELSKQREKGKRR